MPLINQRLAYLLKRCRKDGLRAALMLVGKNLPQPVLEWQIRRRRLQHQRFDRKYRYCQDNGMAGETRRG
jgi:hypothetical protein